MTEKYLGLDQSRLIEMGGLITAREIDGQPALWKKVFEQIQEKRTVIKGFLNDQVQSDTKIILTGAGTSAFIGHALQGSFLRNLKTTSVAIATTDLITHPLDYINPEQHHLLVSFARSGDSPESLGAVELINQVSPGTSHLIITCNKNGKLARMPKSDSVLCIVLPPESNDQGLAMTGSFTSMLLAGLLISKIDQIENLESTIDKLCAYGNKFLGEHRGQFEHYGNLDFERALFLGSGPLLGCAVESHLKLQELSDGIVVCKYDSYLGLRHGPKVVINDKTLVVNLLSNQTYVSKYEIDLLTDISNLPSMAFVTVSEKSIELACTQENISLTDSDDELIDEDFLPVCFVIPAQLLGFYKSANLKLMPDNPSITGTITRVVTGVTIYPFKNHNERILAC